MEVKFYLSYFNFFHLNLRLFNAFYAKYRFPTCLSGQKTVSLMPYVCIFPASPTRPGYVARTY